MWDPLRKKEVAATPEEEVRQWFILRLIEAGVPEGLMRSEVSLKYGSKSFRADILVFDRCGQPLAIVECKRPSVDISAGTAEQALRYHASLGVKFIYLTNGKKTYIYKKENEGFCPCNYLPTYSEMICQQ